MERSHYTHTDITLFTSRMKSVLETSLPLGRRQSVGPSWAIPFETRLILRWTKLLWNIKETKPRKAQRWESQNSWNWSSSLTTPCFGFQRPCIKTVFTNIQVVQPLSVVAFLLLPAGHWEKGQSWRRKIWTAQWRQIFEIPRSKSRQNSLCCCPCQKAEMEYW